MVSGSVVIDRGVLAPHCKLRAAVTAAHRGVGSKADVADFDKPLTPRHASLNPCLRLRSFTAAPAS